MRSNPELIPLKKLLETIVDNRGKSVPTTEHGFPLVATNCIKHSSIYPTFDKVRYVSQDTLDNWFRAHLEPNDILFVNKGTPGRVCLVPDPVSFCAAQDMMAFRADDDKIYYKYLFAVLRSEWIQKKISNYHVGLVIPHFKKQDLDSIQIPQKTDSEQRLIGDMYVDLSEKIELNNKINTELEAMAKLIYDYWFVQFDFPDENGKPYKSSGGKMVYNEDVNREIPDGCKIKELGDCINIFDNLRVPLSRSEREKKKGDIPYYGATSVMGYVNDFLFDDEYILLAEDGSVMNDKGMPIVQFIWGKTWVNNHAHVIQAKNKLHNEFIFQLVKMIHVLLIKTGSIQMKINQNNLKKYKVLIPSLDLIEKYSIKSSQIRKKLINNIEQNQKLAELRDWLLPMLMNGQVKVN